MGARFGASRRSCIGRFIILALTIALITLPILPALALIATGSSTRSSIVIVFAAYGVAMDFALTFVVPELALTTTSVSTAWREGLRLIQQTWPRCGWYVLTPGLTLVALAQGLRPTADSPLANCSATTAVAATLALWFKGAIVAFYLRERPTLRES